MQSHRTRQFTLFLAMLSCAMLSATGQDRTVGASPQAPTAPGSPPAAAGFEPTAWELTVGYQYNRIDIRGAFEPFDTNGLSSSVTRYFGSVLGIEAEAGGGFGTAAPGVSANSVFVGVGPHLAYRRHRHFEPWVHGLVGPEHVNFGGASFSGKTTSAAWTAGGGMDYRFDSGFALRLQADYLGTHFGGTYQRNLQVVRAVVWNF
jgi:opacity protein-like surface antigen